MTNATTRSLGWALGISLALHLILLWQALDAVSSPPAGRAPAPRPGRLSALLHGDTPAVATPAAALATSPAAAPSATAMSQRTTTTVTKRAATPSSVPPPYAPRPIATEDGATTAPTLAPETAAVTGMPAAEATGLDANGMRQYRIELASAARRFRRHATAALAAGRHGTAVVRVDVGAAGRPLTTALERSSDDDRIDAAAVAIIDGAAQATAVPPSLHGRTFSVNLPVEFFAAPE